VWIVLPSSCSCWWLQNAFVYFSWWIFVNDGYVAVWIVTISLRKLLILVRYRRLSTLLIPSHLWIDCAYSCEVSGVIVCEMSQLSLLSNCHKPAEHIGWCLAVVSRFGSSMHSFFMLLWSVNLQCTLLFVILVHSVSTDYWRSCRIEASVLDSMGFHVEYCMEFSWNTTFSCVFARMELPWMTSCSMKIPWSVSLGIPLCLRHPRKT